MNGNMMREADALEPPDEGVKAELMMEPEGYGFGMVWSLRVTYQGRSQTFWLGQDAKVVHRLLGMHPAAFLMVINDKLGIDRPNAPLMMDDQKTRSAVADFLLEAIVATYGGRGDEYEDLVSLDPWDLAVQ